MKIHLEVDCTPEEARAFFGLPDIGGMQKRLVADIEERLRKNLQALDPDALFRNWLPATLKSFEQLQEAFMSQFQPKK